MNQAIEAIAPFAVPAAILLLVAPTFLGVLKRRGLVKGIAIIGLLALFALAYETLAIKTGYPHGGLSYGDTTGSKLFGTTPWTIGLIYPVTVLGLYWLARKITSTGGVVVLSALFATGLNVIIGPALTFMDVWKWESSGPFYGLPLLSFAGWFVGVLFSSWIVHVLWGEESVHRSTAYSLFAIVWFWTGINVGVQQWIPAATGAGAGLLLFVLMSLERRRNPEV